MPAQESKIILTSEDRSAPGWESYKRRGQDAFSALESGSAASAKTVAAAFTGLLGGALTVAGITAFTASIVDSLDALNDAADATGSTVEKMAALDGVGRRTGATLDQMTDVVLALNKSLTKAGDDEGKGIAKALETIGLNAEELRRLDPADAVKKVADALGSYADNGDKARLISVIWKDAKTAAPILKDLAENTLESGAATKELAEQAETLNKQWYQVKDAGHEFALEISKTLIPATLELINFTKRAQQEYGTLGGLFVGILGGGVLKTFGVELDDLQRAQNDIDETYKKLETARSRLMQNQSAKAGNKSYWGNWIIDSSIESAQKDIEKYTATLNNAIKNYNQLAAKRSAASTPEESKPALKFDGIKALPKLKPKPEKVEASDYDALAKAIHGKIAAQELELSTTDKVTGASKEYAEFLSRIKNGDIKLSTQELGQAQSLWAEYLANADLLQQKARALAATNARTSIADLSLSFARDNQASANQLAIMSASARELATSLIAVDEKGRTAGDALRRLLQDGKIDADQFDSLMSDLNDTIGIQKDAVSDLWREQQRLNSTWQYGAEQAMQDYVDNAANVASQTKSAFSSAFQGMEDALVSFVKTGKLNFSALADSIISDMIRIQIRQSMSSWITTIGSAVSSYFAPSANPSASASATPQLLYASRGAAFDRDYQAFARGGIVNRPTPFGFSAGGAMSNGLMGEAGPEAIMPLRRNAAGDLGIVATGSSGVGNVRVEIINQTSQQSQVASATPRFDAEGMVVRVVLRDLNNNGPIRQTLGG